MAQAGRRAAAGPVQAAPRREMAPYYAYRVAEAAVAALPPRAAGAAGAALASAALRLSPRRFEGLRANLRHILPDLDERGLDRLLRDNVRNLGRSWVEVMEMAHRPDTVSNRVQPVDMRYLLEPLQRGRGAVAVSLHFGAWEVGIAGYNHRLGRMALLAEVMRPEALFDRVTAARGAMGVQVIPIDTAAMRSGDPQTARRLGASALREVWRVLRGNGVVAIAIDRDLTGTGVPVEFFGAPARIPLGVVDVAIRSGAALVPVVLTRHGGTCVGPCFPEVVYDPDADRDAEVLRVTRECLAVLEGVIRARPEQWHVLDPIWAPPAPDAS